MTYIVSGGTLNSTHSLAIFFIVIINVVIVIINVNNTAYSEVCKEEKQSLHFTQKVRDEK